MTTWSPFPAKSSEAPTLTRPLRTWRAAYFLPAGCHTSKPGGKPCTLLRPVDSLISSILWMALQTMRW